MIRLKNATILTMNEKFDILSGDVHIENGKIVHIGERKTGVFERDIDLAGHALLPGFKNCHTHSPMTIFRSYADDLKVLDWLTKVIFPYEARLTEDDVFWGQQLALMEYAEGGITAISDMYFFEDAMIEASKDCGIKNVIVSGASANAGEEESRILRLEEEFKKFNGKADNISFRLGFHAEYTSNEIFLSALGELSKKLKAPVSTHLLESSNEMVNFKEKHGKNVDPLDYLCSFGLFENGGTIYHGCHLSKENGNVMKEKNISLVTNPASNLKLASGIPHLSHFLSAGVSLAIGTDGAGSNNSLDMFKEMFLAMGLQKISLDDPTALPAQEVLRMATSTGAKVLGLENSTEIGLFKDADLVAIDLSKPNMWPRSNLLKNIPYSAAKHNVAMTIASGKIVYEKGEFHGFDREKIFAKVDGIIKRLNS